MGKHYMAYAFENPDLYELMFLMTSPIETLDSREDIWEDGHIAFGMLTAIVDECISANYFKNTEVETISMMIWAQVHGLATIHLRKRTMMFCEAERLQRLDSAYELFVANLRNL
jgi:hypothetical protein